MKKLLFIVAALLMCAPPSHGQRWLEKLGKAVEKAADAVDQVTGNDPASRQQREREQRQQEQEQQRQVYREQMERQQAEYDARQAELKIQRGLETFDLTQWASYPEGQTFSFKALTPYNIYEPYVSPNTIIIEVDREVGGVGFTRFVDGVSWVELEEDFYTAFDETGKKIHNTRFQYTGIGLYSNRIPYYHNGVAIHHHVPAGSDITNATKTYVWLMDKQGKLFKHLKDILPSYSKFNNAGVAWAEQHRLKPHAKGKQAIYITHHDYNTFAVLLNTKGEIVFETGSYMPDEHIFHIRNMQNGRMAYYDGEKRLWGFLDENFQIAIAPQFRFAYNFVEELALTQDANGKWGFIDASGRAVIPHRYTNEPSSFFNGYAVVRKTEGNDYGYIDKSGTVVKDGYTSATPFSGKYAYVNGRDSSGRMRNMLINSGFGVVTIFGEFSDQDYPYGIKLDGMMYMAGNPKIFETIEGQRTNFSGGLAEFYVKKNGRAMAGFVKPNGEIYMLIRRPEY